MRWLLVAIVALVAIQRGIELVVNRRNQARLIERGGRLVREDGYRWIVLVHAAWFVGLVAEFHVAPWAGWWQASLAILLLAGAAEALRLWTIATLGSRWTTRVVVVPGETLVREGPYRWLDHPNYVAVTVLLAAVPAAFSLWVTAALVAGLNGVALRRRVRIEDAALERARDPGTITQVDA